MAEKKTEETTTVIKAPKPETVEFEVTLSSGQVIKLEALSNQKQYPLEAGVRAQRGETMAFLDLVLTRTSRFRLQNSTAVLDDFEAIAIAMGEAVGAVESDKED